MPRSVNSVASRAKRKKILKQAKGYKNIWIVRSRIRLDLNKQKIKN